MSELNDLIIRSDTNEKEAVHVMKSETEVRLMLQLRGRGVSTYEIARGAGMQSQYGVSVSPAVLKIQYPWSPSVVLDAPPLPSNKIFFVDYRNIFKMLR